MRQKRSGWLSKLVILVFAVYTAMTLISLQAQINLKKAEIAELEANLAAQNLLTATLREDIGSDDPGEIFARLARDKLGLVIPGEIIIVNRTP